MSKYYWPGPPKQAILIWCITAAALAWQFALQMSIGAISGKLRTTFNASALDLGLLSSSFFYIYVALQTPVGILVDKFGVRSLIAVGMIICFIGCLLFSSTNNLEIAMLGRILMGAGTAFGFVGTINISHKWFPIAYLPFMIGLVESVAMLGGFCGNMLLSYFSDLHPWQSVFKFTIIISAVLSFLAFKFIQDNPPNPILNEIENKKEIPKLAIIAKSLIKIIKIKQVWYNSIYLGILYMIVTVIAALWLTPFLKSAYSFSPTNANFLTSLILIGVGVGAPVICALFGHSEYKYNVLSILALACCIIFSILIYILPLPWYILCFLTFTLGFLGGGVLLCFGIAADWAPTGARSTTVGVTNTITMMTAPLLQPMIGATLNYLAPDIPGELEIYTVEHFQIALSILPILFFIAFIVSLFLKPNKH